MTDPATAPTARIAADAAAADTGAATPDASRPGIRTTEFWLSAAATLGGIVLASGALAEGSVAAQIVGGLLSLLASLGYTASRTALKRAAPDRP